MPKRSRTKVPFVVRMIPFYPSALTLLLFSDLMWSDPDDIENWAVSPRGAGWLFGGSVVKEVSIVNELIHPPVS